MTEWTPFFQEEEMMMRRFSWVVVVNPSELNTIKIKQLHLHYLLNYED